MNDTMSLLLATTILATGGACLYMYKNPENEEQTGGDTEYNEDNLFGGLGNFFSLNEDEESKATPVNEASIKIGVNGFASGGYLNGTISEVLIYNSVLSNADRQKVEGYLAWKWSIQSSLLVNHPYYNASP